MANSDKIAILGAGSWGSTLAWLLSGNGKNVSLWSHDPAKAKKLAADGKIEKPHQYVIPHEVEITADIEISLKDAAVVLLCCDAQSMQELANKVKAVLVSTNKKPILVSAAKGIELKTFRRMSQILSDTLDGVSICALSGPNLASEILQSMPAATVVASADNNAAKAVQSHISVSTFRVYTSNDLPGVEFGGALKNVIAIAAGAVDGLNLGANAKAALMTRGLAEMTRLSVVLGANAATLAGLSGMGDLVATSYSRFSRNYCLGHEIAKGKTVDTISQELGAVVEGITTSYAVCELAKSKSIELPIAEQVRAVLTQGTTPKEAIMALMTRPLVSE